jgi:hypothetical protein
MTTKDPKTVSTLTSEIEKHEAAIAQKRIEREAAQAAENERRRPLLLALQKRAELIELIALNQKRRDAHAGDNAELEKIADAFFLSGDWQSRMYQWLCPSDSYPFFVAARAVELLTVRLKKTEKELADLETKIKALAVELNLVELLPAELKPA